MPSRMPLVVILALIAPASFAQDVPVIDYRDGSVLDFADTAQWSPVAERLGGDVEVLGEVRGAFTAPGADDKAYLVSSGTPVAAEPFPEIAQRIVVFEGDDQVADLTLPENSTYSRAITAVDVDGDGISEIVLEGSFYNMGTSSIGLDVVRLGETAEVIQTLPEVYVDSCDAGVGETSISASAVSLVAGQLVATAETLDCP